ncbi:MAG: NAD-dependent epimerase/dehydratase [Alphaproteobacteria bacterium]|nr:MAG: NAD-dependent epimerase/dehydratase [Caulobacteraceae bacterium]TPW08117.1 MAG: NAD-dependent epimerase/dehydratase [Alphaproteobacteria bacterium]
MRVLVTGTSGFIGRWTCDMLSSLLDDAEIVRAGRRVSPMCDVAVDLVNPESVAALVDATRPDAVVHLAGIASPAMARDNPAETFAVNAGATALLAETLRARCPEAHFVLAGSGLAYGATFFDHDGPVPESAALRPRDIYGASKAAAEAALSPSVEAGLRATVLRFFNIVGPGQSTAYALPKFAAQIAAIEAGRAAPAVRTSRLDEGRDFVDVRDCARAIASVISCRAATPGLVVFNIASGRSRIMGEVLRDMIALARVRITVDEHPEEGPVGRALIARGDACAIRAATGWRAETPWESTLRDMLDEHRAGAQSSAPQ